MYRVVNRIENGEGPSGRHRPAGLGRPGNIMGRTICALGDAAAMPVRGFLKHYRDEFRPPVSNTNIAWCRTTL